MTKQLIIDPPAGWKYGFPKPMPEEIMDGSIKEFSNWLIKEGYPREDIELAVRHSRYWEQEIESPD